MKGLRITLLVVIAFALIFSVVGCAARKTIKPEAKADQGMEAQVDDGPVQESKGTKYVVRRGDTLWGIASSNRIYEDPFQWPLLFKSNRDQVEDPDMIEVDQELEVKKDISSSEVSDARQKAMDTPPYRPHTSPRKKLPLRY